MNALPFERLVRHSYRDGTYSYHSSPVAVNQDDVLVSVGDAVPSGDPADRFTYWPPQPATLWLESQPLF